MLRKYSSLFIFTLILIVASCDSINTCEEPEKPEPVPEPGPRYSSIQIYNEDGTPFKGNGEIFVNYTSNDGNTVELFHASVTNGEYGRRFIFDDKGFTYIDPKPSDFYELYRSLQDNDLLFAYLPSDFNDTAISISVSDIVDNIQYTQPKSSFWGYRFYDDDNDEYKILAYIKEKKDKNGYVTERLFYGDFVSRNPLVGAHYLKGELSYTKELLDLHNGKTEKAEVTIRYDLNIIDSSEPILPSYQFLPIYVYTKAVYTIITETTNSIYYKVDIIVWDKANKNYSLDDWNDYRLRFTLLDQYFRIRQ